jgi:hypothetical protein
LLRLRATKSTSSAAVNAAALEYCTCAKYNVPLYTALSVGIHMYQNAYAEMAR